MRHTPEDMTDNRPRPIGEGSSSSAIISPAEIKVFSIKILEQR
jgi:hypothetical protein